MSDDLRREYSPALSRLGVVLDAIKKLVDEALLDEVECGEEPST